MVNNPLQPTSLPHDSVVLNVARVGVEMQNVSKTFIQESEQRVILHNVSLKIQAGEFISIIGPSGVGKTTLLRLIAGVDQAYEGTIQFLDSHGRDAGRNNVVYHPQRDVLLEWQRVIDNATLGARLAGVSRSQAKLQAEYMLQDWGLGDVVSAWPHTLSGGMRQRVAMVRSLLTPRPVLALDEPFGALDALTRQSMQTWLQRLRTHDQRTAIMVTHDIDEALAVSSRIVVLTGQPGVISHIEAVPQELVSDAVGQQKEVSKYGLMTLNDRLDSSDYRESRRQLTASLAGN